MDELYGLVLSGGQSTRMGQDKGKLQYHGVPQRTYLYQLLQQVCSEVFLSVRPRQEEEVVDGDFQFLLDSHDLKGPFNGILSALQQHPDKGWLVVACDLPLVNLNTLQKLIAARNPGKIATAYAAKGTDLPEPLLAIWEPAGYEPALAFTQAGIFCPRKFLLNSDVQILHPADDAELYNANRPEDYAYIMQKLNHGQPL
jgi:molybdopterin-guanine dinucleotide biosynthesis protein A